MTRVLVTDAGRGSAMAIIRSLGQHGVDVVAADSNRLSPGFVSRFSSGRVAYPPPDDGDTVAALANAAAAHNIDLVVPVGEDIVMLLSAERKQFSGVTTIALPDHAALETVRDKLETVKLADRLEIPAPRTALARDAEEALAQVHEFRWPVVLKPRASRALRQGGRVEAFGVAYAADASQLAERMRRFEGRTSVLLQEYCEGEGHGVGLLMNRGVPLAAFQHRRLREVPFTGGPSSLRESVPLDPVLFQRSVRLLQALEWTGPAMVEFKVSATTAALMEINGRIWGSLGLAVKSGVDFPRKIVDLYLEPSEPRTEAMRAYALGVRSRDLGLELTWIASVLGGRRPYDFLPSPRRRDALGAAIRLFDPRDGFDILSARDPLPGLAELLSIVRKVPRRIAPVARTHPRPIPGKP